MTPTIRQPYKPTLAIVCIAFLTAACASTKPLPEPAATTLDALAELRVFDHTHATFDRLLETFVRNGRVDYRGIRAAPDDLYAYTEALGAVSAPVLGRWSREQQMAY